MRIIEMITEAARLSGRDDLAAAIEEGRALTAEEDRLKGVFLTYLNAVVQEIARCYLPLKHKVVLTSEDKMFYLTDFPRIAIRIKRVTDYKTGKDLDFTTDFGYIRVPAEEIEVEYYYTLEKLTDYEYDFSYPLPYLNERAIIYGMVSEHLLVLGDAGYKDWESKYHNAVGNAQIKYNNYYGYVPLRSWV